MPLSKATKALQCMCEQERKTPGIINGSMIETKTK